MTERWGRAFGGLAALAGLWVVVYWWWEPRGGRITYDDGTPARAVRGPVAEPAVEVSPRVQAASAPVASPVGVNAGKDAPGAKPAGGVDRVRLAAGATKSETRVEPRAAVIPPRFKDYTIKRGDTLKSIALRELGSESQWEAIARSNPLKDIERLRENRVIRIPLDPTNIQGKPAAGSAGTPVLAAQGATPAERMVEYTVKPGDTLSKIAADHYGSSRFTGLIVEGNGMRDADSLRVGQTIKLPPKPR